MNTYILNGPLDAVPLKKDLRILECDFASPILRRSLRDRFRSWKSGRELADMNRFGQQVKDCDVLILHGGSTPHLIHRLTELDGWREHLNNKIIVAYSAGVSALTSYSFNRDHNVILRGLGILPFKSIVHYNPYKDWPLLMELAKFRPHEKLPLLTVSDDEYYVFER